MRKVLSTLLIIFMAFTTAVAQNPSPELLQKARNGDAAAQTKVGDRFFENKDYVHALEWYERAAAQNNVDAILQLIEIYENGYGVAKDEKTGVMYEKKAAALGSAKAQLYLGNTYLQGYGGEQKNYSKAVEWYRKAAEQGYAKAQHELGGCYYRGNGVTKDYAKAVEWFRKAAEQGYDRAQNALGVRYAEGKGVTKDYAKAVEWYRKAAEQGNVWGQFNLGFNYYWGHGVTRDYVKAVEWFRKAAEQGNASAQQYLGTCYDLGDGVAEDDSKAVQWYRKAAEQGDAQSQYDLGQCYYYGKGVAKDYTKAVEWYRKAAEQEHENAISKLSLCYEKGHGVPKYEGAALTQKKNEIRDIISWLKKGDEYMNGEGRNKDLSLAVDYYKKAADKGSITAKSKLPIAYYQLGLQQYTNENYFQAFVNLVLAAEDKNNPIPQAMNLLAGCYEYGYGTTVDLSKAKHWREEAAKYNDEEAKRALSTLSGNDLRESSK